MLKPPKSAAPEMPGYLSVVEAAKYLGISRETLVRYFKRELLHPVRFGKNKYVSKEEIDKLEKPKAGPKPKSKSQRGSFLQSLTVEDLRRMHGRTSVSLDSPDYDQTITRGQYLRNRERANSA